ncbi:MAG: hypothetical protein RL762_91 [Bacteroidota bacterium]|jgi:serine O-acetyltransferase
MPIQHKKDLRQYLLQDFRANGVRYSILQLPILFFKNRILFFLWLMRIAEFHKNRKNKVRYVLFFLKYRKVSRELGFSIPLNVFGPGLAIPHYGTIVVNGNARVGANCRIQTSTNIGASGGSINAPQIGDNVYIGPGAKIYGDIQLGNNIAIAANAAVSSSFLEENWMIGGIPAKQIKQINIKQIIKHIN